MRPRSFTSEIECTGLVRHVNPKSSKMHSATSVILAYLTFRSW